MATVHDLLARKGTEVTSLPPTATVAAAARLLNERGIGGLVVLQDGQLVGIFTERDVLRRVVAAGRDPAATTLAEVMTAPVVTCGPAMPLEACAALMTARHIRHLPVEGEAGLVGLVTIGDILAHQVGEQQDTIQYMHNYIYDLR